nr:hypothetical protein BgiMline_032854 [Biomphalaria glabrata]
MSSVDFLKAGSKQRIQNSSDFGEAGPSSVKVATFDTPNDFSSPKLQLLKEIVQVSSETPIIIPPEERLEDVLRYQLVVCSKVTMATQTNWEWRVMAERWRRAPIVEAKTKPMDRNDAKAHLVQLKLKNILDDGYLHEELAEVEETGDWLKRVWKESKRCLLEKIRAVRACDKISDTSDLEVNTSDSPMVKNQWRLTGRRMFYYGKSELRSNRSKSHHSSYFLDSARGVSSSRSKLGRMRSATLADPFQELNDSRSESHQLSDSYEQRRKSTTRKSILPESDELQAIREIMGRHSQRRKSETGTKHENASTENEARLETGINDSRRLSVKIDDSVPQERRKSGSGSGASKETESGSRSSKKHDSIHHEKKKKKSGSGSGASKETESGSRGSKKTESEPYGPKSLRSSEYEELPPIDTATEVKKREESQRHSNTLAKSPSSQGSTQISNRLSSFSDLSTND